MKRKLLNHFRLIVTVFALFIASTASSYGETADSTVHQSQATLQAGTHGEAAHGEGKFNAGKMIIDHIVDAHEWHILTYKEFHLSIPLPVILIDNGKLVIFSSSHFHHGHESYMGYKLMMEGKDKGNIVKVLEAVKQ